MNRRIPFAACLIPLLLVAGCGGGEREQGKVPADRLEGEAAPLEYLVRVGAHALSEKEFGSQIPAEFSGLLTAEEKRDFLDRWVDTELLCLAAEARGLMEDPELEMRLRQYRREFVANHLLQRVLEERVLVTEPEIADYYAEHLDEYSSEYRYREIVVHNQNAAEDLCGRLNSKRISFTRAAEKNSLSSSARVGGDMGWLAKGAMPPEVEERIIKMKPQEISTPFETAWGWTIIQFREKRQAENALDLQEVRDEILRYLTMERRRRVYADYLAELREIHPITYHPQLDERLRADEFTSGAEESR